MINGRDVTLSDGSVWTWLGRYWEAAKDGNHVLSNEPYHYKSRILSTEEKIEVDIVRMTDHTMQA